MHFKISYYYLATGMEGKADSIPATHVEAESRDKAIFKFQQEHGHFPEHDFNSFMRLDQHVREWGLTVKPWRQHSKKGAGRPRKTATIQLNRRVAWNNYDSTKTLLDAVIDDPSMLPALLAIARSHTAGRPVHNHPHTGTTGN